jgi:protein gp37
MGSKTGIEWTDATWNPIIGCSRVSEGCRNCYAEGIAGRFGAGKETVYSGLTQIVNGRAVWTGQIKETRQLLQPLSWRKPKRVFVNSMSDLFHENVTDEMRDRIFAVMALCPQHTFQVLTKRPERMLGYLTGERKLPGLEAEPSMDSRRAIGLMMVGLIAEEPKVAKAVMAQLGDGLSVSTEPGCEGKLATWPLPNVWLGVSVENQKAADERIPLLLQTPAAVRFISAEPLLGPIDLDRVDDCEDGYFSALDGMMCCEGRGWKQGPKLDWVICGGESGPGARPMHPDWARSLRDQCQAAGVPFFFKQWGEHVPFMQSTLPDSELSGKCSGLLEDGTESNKVAMYRVGKKAAGALLDGVEHKEFPPVRA